MTSRPDPVVLISGQLLTDALWAPQVAALEDRFDLTIADNAGADTIAGMAEKVLAQAPARFGLCGHAMGGFIAFEILRRAPERVSRLALLSTLAPADTPAQTERREGYLRLVEAGRFDEVARERVPMLTSPARRQDAALIAAIAGMAAATGAETFLRQQRAIMTRTDSRPSLAAIACPTLIVFGEADGIVNRGHQDEMLAAIPDARLEILEGCGHLMTLEQPEATNRLLEAWFGAEASQRHEKTA